MSYLGWDGVGGEKHRTKGVEMMSMAKLKKGGKKEGD